jgi:hypothetical protein
MSTMRAQGAGKPDAGAGSPPFRRQAVRELPIPEEVAQALEECRRSLGFFQWRKRRLQIQDEFLLQWYYQGQNVAYLPTPRGLVVVAAGRMDSEEFGRAWDSLPRAEQRHAVLYSLGRWDADDSRLPRSVELPDY